MTRREFTKSGLLTLTGIAFLDTLFKQQLFANPIKPIADHWLKELHTMCLGKLGSFSSISDEKDNIHWLPKIWKI